MPLSIFDNKALMPDDEMLDMVLGSAKALYKNIIQQITDFNKEWKFYGKEAGWTLNLKSGKRTLFVFVPLQECFKAGFVLGERAVLAARNSGLPKQILANIPDKKDCVCGYSFWLDVKTADDTDIVIKFLNIKNEN